MTSWLPLILVLNAQQSGISSLVKSTYFHRTLKESHRTYSDDQIQLRDNATTVLRNYCSNCHYDDGPSSQSAKAIFDLKQNNWWYRMSDDQLNSAVFRVDSLTNLTPLQKEQFRQFVDVERTFRRRD